MKVMTTGCFDVLHPGHIALLRKASDLGEVYVFINTDESIKRLKGKNRPILSYEERAIMLKSIKYVHKVLPFSGDVPGEELFALLKPNYYIKSDEYKSNLPEMRWVKKYNVEMIWFERDKRYSTTKMVKK